MGTKRLLIIYYTEKGGTKRMAEEIGKGATKLGVKVDLVRVEDCRLKDLVETDGIVIGSPTYFSNVAWQIKKLIDESIILYRKNHQLKGKVGGCFTSSGTKRDGMDCIRMVGLTLSLHHKLETIPGIISTTEDDEEEVALKCQQYGMEIARKILP